MSAAWINVCAYHVVSALCKFDFSFVQTVNLRPGHFHFLMLVQFLLIRCFGIHDLFQNSLHLPFQFCNENQILKSVRQLTLRNSSNSQELSISINQSINTLNPIFCRYNPVPVQHFPRRFDIVFRALRSKNTNSPTNSGTKSQSNPT